jgi:hypothetical protein
MFAILRNCSNNDLGRKDHRLYRVVDMVLLVAKEFGLLLFSSKSQPKANVMRSALGAALGVFVGCWGFDGDVSSCSVSSTSLEEDSTSLEENMGGQL